VGTALKDPIIIPELLKTIIHWEKEFVPEVPYLETPTGYFLRFNEEVNGGYPCSPADAILFANTGMDGIHYAFLTDFGTVANLEEAPIVCVSPMDFGNCVRLVASNLEDFFRLKFYGHEGLLMNDFTTKEEYAKYCLKEQDEPEVSEYFDHNKWEKQRAVFRAAAIQTFHFEPIAEPFDYIQQLRAARQKQIVLPTADRLGVRAVTTSALKQTYLPHPWHGQEIPYLETDEMRDFVDGAEIETLLSFVRDYQNQAVDDTFSLAILCRALEARGFQMEAMRLSYCIE
jgi:hypothetical protein